MANGAHNSHSAMSAADFLNTQGSCIAPLDSAAEYIRHRLGEVIPLYVLAMLPYSIIVLLLIDAINSRQRLAVAQYCMYLVPATAWRWIWLARLQQRVQEDMQSRRAGRFWPRIPSILLLRVLASNAMVWGSFAVCVPTLYGLFVGGFAAPLLLENSDPAYGRFRSVISWVTHSAWRLTRVALAVGVGAGLLAVVLFVNQLILAQFILPSLLGVDAAELNLTLNGWAWRLSFLYFFFLLVDCFWSVAAVILYHDSQSRRMATDLRIRLHNMAESQS
jgi:hypothetical protein